MQGIVWSEAGGRSPGVGLGADHQPSVDSLIFIFIIYSSLDIQKHDITSLFMIYRDEGGGGIPYISIYCYVCVFFLWRQVKTDESPMNSCWLFRTLTSEMWKKNSLLNRKIHHWTWKICSMFYFCWCVSPKRLQRLAIQRLRLLMLTRWTQSAFRSV